MEPGSIFCGNGAQLGVMVLVGEYLISGMRDLKSLKTFAI